MPEEHAHGKDVVCGRDVDEKRAQFKLDWYGKTYYFCSEMCLDQFRKDPQKYLGDEYVRWGPK